MNAGGNLNEQVVQLLSAALQFKQSGNYAESEKIFKQLLGAFPQSTELQFHYAELKTAEGKFPEARKLLQAAIRAEPRVNYITALAQTYWNDNDVMKAMEIIRNAAKSHPDNFNLTKLCIMFDIEDGYFSKAILSAEKALTLPYFSALQTAQINIMLAISHYIQNNIDSCSKALGDAKLILNDGEIDKLKPIEALRVLKIYGEYLANIINWRRQHPNLYKVTGNSQIFIIGDSHSLSPAYINTNGSTVIPKLIFGAKIWHLRKEHPETAKKAHLTRILKSANPQIPVIFNFGEIDCRPNEGFFVYSLKNPQIDIPAHIHKTVSEYVSYIKKLTDKFGLKAFFLGVPAPTLSYLHKSGIADGKMPDYLQIPQLFNNSLSQICGDKYIDLYKITEGGNSFAKDGVHIDLVHLKPDLLLRSDLCSKLML